MSVPPVSGSEQKYPAPKFLAESKDPKAPDLTSMVDNIRYLPALQPPMPGAKMQVIDTDLALHRAMNLIPFPVKKMKKQETDPTLFFRHIGCNEAPSSCESHHLQGFYQLVSSYHFSDALSFRNFLDFDMFSNLKKIHESCPALKPQIEGMIKQSKKLRAEASYAIWIEKNYTKYIDRVGLFRQQLYELLQKKTPNETVEYLFPKILKNVDQNCNFLRQFSAINYNSFLFNVSLRLCSGTHTILPVNASQIPEVLKHFQNFAELTIESMMYGHKSKLIPVWNQLLLQEVLAKVRTLARAHPDRWQEEAKELLVLCRQMASDTTETIFSHIDIRAFFDPTKSEDELVSLLSQQLSSIKDGSIQKKIIGMMEFVNLLTEFSCLIEDSILNHIDRKYVLEMIYSNRIIALLGSLNKESCFVTGQKHEVVGLERLRGEFFATLSRLEFSAKAIALLHCTQTKTPLLWNLYDKHLYRLLKRATEEAIESLQKYCKKQPADLQGKSLFQETQWLAKSLLLVHDLGMRLKDPAITEGIEFHPEYIQLIHQYDPSVWLQGDVEEPEVVSETESCAPMAVPEPPESTPAKPAEIKTEFATAPPEAAPKAPTLPAPPVRRPPPVVRKPDKLDRGEIRQAIIGTQGNLRKMSQILRKRLGWSIQHHGTRHPTVLDGNGNPVAPVPTTGHAGIGTVRSVAESVCVAAETQGLM
jgi:hypothetical protein